MFNPDTVPSHSIKRGLLYGAACPISAQEFLNLTNGAIDDSKTMESLVAAQKLHTFGIMYAQDCDDNSPPVYVARRLSMIDRRALFNAGGQV